MARASEGHVSASFVHKYYLLPSAKVQNLPLVNMQQPNKFIVVVLNVNFLNSHIINIIIIIF